MANNDLDRVRKVGNRRQFLVYMDPVVIKKVKLEALNRDVSASLVVEEAVKKYLARRKKKQTGNNKSK